MGITAGIGEILPVRASVQASRNVTPHLENRFPGTQTACQFVLQARLDLPFRTHQVEITSRLAGLHGIAAKLDAVRPEFLSFNDGVRQFYIEAETIFRRQDGDLALQFLTAIVDRFAAFVLPQGNSCVMPLTVGTAEQL